jgi:hypothetical protein
MMGTLFDNVNRPCKTGFFVIQTKVPDLILPKKREFRSLKLTILIVRQVLQAYGPSTSTPGSIRQDI